MTYVASSISKHYGGVRALAGVDLEVHPGEVHALLGANGAGKSTLVKVLVGATQPSEGKLTLDGAPISLSGVQHARQEGIAIVSQELTLFPDLDVLENLFLLREPLRAGVIDRKEMRVLAAPVLEAMGTTLDLEQPVGTLPLAQRQIVEIARALIGRPRILFLDEPTSALAADESRRLLELVARLREQDVGIVFVSHHLEDVFEIADTVTILRSGRVVVARQPKYELTIPDTIAHMLGPAVKPPAPEQPRDGAEPVIPLANPSRGPLRLEGVSVRGALEDLNLVANPGEVVGLAGLEGSGAQIALRAVFGQRRLSSGKVVLPSGRSGPRSMEAAVRAGVAYVPSDRKRFGLMLGDSINDNVGMVTAGALGRQGPVLRRSRLRERAEWWRERLDIRLSSSDAPVASLSGGNQQKVVLAKWLDAKPDVVLLDDPTRGVDVGAKAEIQKLIREVAVEGAVVLYASNDFEEMAAVCDRVVIFFGGRMRGELTGEAITEHGLLSSVTTGSTAGD